MKHPILMSIGHPMMELYTWYLECFFYKRAERLSIPLRGCGPFWTIACMWSDCSDDQRSSRSIAFHSTWNLLKLAIPVMSKSWTQYNPRISAGISLPQVVFFFYCHLTMGPWEPSFSRALWSFFFARRTCWFVHGFSEVSPSLTHGTNVQAMNWR